MRSRRIDDVLVATALAACATLCLAFRYLPMVDLPQHYAMVSILVHRSDPGWGFAQRYATDFLHRPYATVYWFGATLARVMPLHAAMRIVVAVCTIAPFVGAHALLVATGRPRVWLLAAIPFAFGSIWHWGFLNFLLGTGLFLAGLALVARASRLPSLRSDAALFVLSLVLFFTHLHGVVMLLAFAPVFAWAWRDDAGGWQGVARRLVPLAPAALAVAALVLPTWAQTSGAWSTMNPSAVDRVRRFAEFLDAGSPDPWPQVWTAAFAGVVGASLALGGEPPRPRRALVALGLALAAQVVLYFALPLGTATVAYVSPRHALLAVLLVPPLLPELGGRAAAIARAGCAIVAATSIALTASHLACFDHEAHDFDAIEAAMAPDKRVASLLFARASACTHAMSFPFQHFAAYYQADHGGDLDRSLASRWNIPVRYRDDYRRYPFREQIEWAPQLFSPNDARHFDYVIVRGARPLPPSMGLRVLTTSGAWTLYENPDPVPPDVPAP